MPNISEGGSIPSAPAFIMPQYIYIDSNPSMPGLIKVGRTDRDPHERTRELYTTSVPTRFVVEAAFAVKDSKVAEDAAHTVLKDFRVDNNREFFEIDVTGAIKMILPIIDEYEIAYANANIAVDEIASKIELKKVEGKIASLFDKVASATNNLHSFQSQLVEEQKRVNNLRPKIAQADATIARLKQKLNALGPRPVEKRSKVANFIYSDDAEARIGIWMWVVCSGGVFLKTNWGEESIGLIIFFSIFFGGFISGLAFFVLKTVLAYLVPDPAQLHRQACKLWTYLEERIESATEERQSYSVDNDYMDRLKKRIADSKKDVAEVEEEIRHYEWKKQQIEDQFRQDEVWRVGNHNATAGDDDDDANKGMDIAALSCVWTEGEGDHPDNPPECYRNGKRHELWKWRSKYAVHKGPFVDGKMHGIWEREDHFDREHGCRAPFLNGVRYGAWLYDKDYSYRVVDGRVEDGEYVDGKKHGQWEYRYADAKFEPDSITDGNVVHELERPAAAGRIETGPYVQGERHGQWEKRYASGRVRCTIYENGEVVSRTDGPCEEEKPKEDKVAKKSYGLIDDGQMLNDVVG